MINDINPIARAVAAGAILSVFVLANPSPAAAQTSSSPASPSPTTQSAPMHKASPMRMSPSERVEARIKDLHARLQITPAQETQWNGVAQAMRDNAKAIEAVAADRKQKIATMNAVDDLRSYESLAQTHADGMKKLVSAFTPLYDSMSDSQKKTADTLFRHRARHHPSPAKKS